uniref:Predicted protein n=1 Tax=Hordeum vulgare subsp. vulgare TaxID=112509 RepID=F2DZB9_HORVV|nr:predicted protein [Hordeum vulgare subsp. vulgare]
MCYRLSIQLQITIKFLNHRLILKSKNIILQIRHKLSLLKRQKQIKSNSTYKVRLQLETILNHHSLQDK